MNFYRFQKPLFIFLGISLAAGFLGLFVSPVSASGFSGSDCNNYTCPVLREQDDDGNYISVEPIDGDCGRVHTRDGNYYCQYNFTESGFRETQAIPNPPQLRVIEVWVVRIIYSAWAMAGIYFTLVLMWIGFNYVTSFGNEVALADVVKKFRYWLIGLILVFLSYPILVTFFSVLPLDTSQNCYEDLELDTPAFQFFFPEACGTAVSQEFDDTVSSCTTACNQELRRQGLGTSLGAGFCTSVCSSIIRRCIDLGCSLNTSGTPDADCVNQCVGGDPIDEIRENIINVIGR